MATIEIQPSDVIKLLEQFLKENKLYHTLHALQEETSVDLNTVDSVEQFVDDITSGNWDVVLRTVKLLRLPDEKLIELYEQITIELIELRETKAALWLMNKTEPMLKLKIDNPDKHQMLENLTERSFFDHRNAYPDGMTKERRRAAIAASLKKEVSVVPPQRLLYLLCDALKWQKHEGLLPSGSSMNIFTGKTHIASAEEETYPSSLHRHCIKPIIDTEPIFVCCACFSPDGHYMVVGYSTGLVEIRNPITGRLATDLKYQASKNFIVTPSKTAALCLSFSSSEMLAIGDKNGDVSVWKLQTGKYLQIFESVHNKGVNCLTFHRNNREILSGGHDAAVKLHGMRSNRTIRDYKGHTSFVNDAVYSKDDHHIVTGSSDCTVKVWNAKTAIILAEYRSNFKVHTVLLMPRFKNDIFLVGDRSNCVNLIDIEARVRVSLVADALDEENSNESPPKFLACCSSPKGDWIYSIDSQSMYCFNYKTKSVAHVLKLHEDKDNDTIGVFHHPLMNCIATYDIKGNLKLWKP